MSEKVRIAHLAGPTATIQNTPPLVTSNKARAKYGLAVLKDADGAPRRFDALRAQRLAAPATVYVEQFSAHPLESDAARSLAPSLPLALHGAPSQRRGLGRARPPDGFIGADGVFRTERQGADDKPVYEIELRPEDGVYPLPYMALRYHDGGAEYRIQANGEAWEEECVHPGAPEEGARQGFFPDGSRSFEEIDRLSVNDAGLAASGNRRRA